MAESVFQEIETVLKVRDEASSAVKRLGVVAGNTAHQVDRLSNISTNRAAPSFTNLGNAFARVTSHGQELKSVLFELAAGVGIATTLKGAFDKFIDTNAEAETATRSLGAALSGLYKYGVSLDPIANLHAGLQRSADVMDRLNQAAFSTGIPMSALATTASSLAPAIAQAGGSTDQLANLTIDLAKVSRGLGVSYQESASQLSMAVRFGRVRPGAGLMAQLGLNKEMLAGMTEMQRLAYIQGRIKLLNPDAIASITTYSDLMAMVRERADQIAEAAGKPLFLKAKKTVKEVGDWIEKNRDQIERTVTLVADKFVVALEAAISAVRFLYDNWERVKLAVLTIVGIMAAHKAATWAKEFGSSIADVTRRIAEMHAVKLGQQFGDAAAPGLANAGTTAGTGIGKAAAAGMILEAALIGYAIGTAINSWLMKQEWWNKLMTPTKGLGERAQDLEMARAEADRADRHKRLAVWAKEVAASGPAEYRGNPQAFLLRQKARVAAGEDVFISGTQKLAKIGDFTGAIEALGPMLGPLKPAEMAGGPERPKEVAKQTFDFRGSRFDITQNFAEGFDPDRIAVAFTNDLASLGEMRSSSTYAPIAGVR